MRPITAQVASPKQSFSDFKKLLWPEYEHAAHQAAIDKVLSQVSEYILSNGQRGIKRAMIFMPPRHGKSKSVSHYYPAWMLGQKPNLRIIMGSYGASLAHRNSKFVRNLIESPDYAALYPDTKLSGDTKAKNEWDTTKGGGVIAVGVDGAVTGSGGKLIILDDVVKSRAEAESEVKRLHTVDWYTNDLLTRLEEPNGAIILMMCMTGDTPVMMADGTERPLREINVGDQVATYDNGALSASKVLKHTNNGSDLVYEIRMISGKIVHANERHPFLVEEHGELKWIRLKNLTTAHKIVSLKASGREKLAALRDAKAPLVVEDIAHITTAKSNGQTGIAPRLRPQRITEKQGSNIVTESLLMSTMLCMKRKRENALFAINLQQIMSAPTGAGSCALTIATKQEKSEGFYATIVTLPLDMPNQKQQPLLWSNTSDFTTDEIVSITPSGFNEVFDVQIERTENFIANGLVSHNTRWHMNDLAGYLLDSEADEWHVLNLPALAEENDPLGREIGAALWPEVYGQAFLEHRHERMGEYAFASLYQQRPMPSKAGLFDVSKISTIDYAPPKLERVRFYDLAVTAKKHSDYTVGVLLGIDANENIYILHVYRVQKTPVYVEQDIVSNALLDGREVRIRLEAEKAGIVQLDYLLKRNELRGYRLDAKAPDGDKYTRAQPIASRVNAEKVFMVRGEWNRAFLDELAVFPMGSHDDQVDALSGAYDALISRKSGVKVDRYA